MRIKDIALIGMMSAILIVVQVTLGFIPNVELVSLLLILYTLIFGCKTLWMIYIFVIVEGFIYGIGIWWFNYLYVWAVLFLIVILLRKLRSVILWSVISGGFGIGYGFLCSIPYFLAGGPASGFAYWVSGIPFDITHGIANFIITLILFRPLYLILDLINKKIIDQH